MAKEAKEKEPTGPVNITDWMSKVNKALSGDVVSFGGQFDALKVKRFSSGILSLDLGLGGGWPFGRMSVLAGEYSTGKTIIATKAAASVEDYDHTTKKHRDRIGDLPFTAGRALIVDTEGAFDIDWAVANGFNKDYHVVTRTDTSEQAIDIVAAALEDNMFDLIVVDSLAQMTPSKEVDESSEEWQMGLAARLLNKAFRRWGSMLNANAQKGITGPQVLCLNQFRMKIGMMFGDPRTLPGGKGQEFFSSIIIYTKSGDYDAKAMDLACVELSGVVQKNKTYIPKRNYTFKLYLKDGDGYKKGEIDNLSDLMSMGKSGGFIVTDKGKVRFNGKEYDTQKELLAHLKVSKFSTRALWKSIVNKETGTVV